MQTKNKGNNNINNVKRTRKPNLFCGNFIALYYYDPDNGNDEFYCILESEKDIHTYLHTTKHAFSSSLCHLQNGRSKCLEVKGVGKLIPYVFQIEE